MQNCFTLNAKLQHLQSRLGNRLRLTKMKFLKKFFLIQNPQIIVFQIFLHFFYLLNFKQKLCYVNPPPHPPPPTTHTPPPPPSSSPLPGEKGENNNYSTMLTFCL